MSKPKEFKFKIIQEPDGFAVLWDVESTARMESGDFHVIDYSAYQDLQQKLEIAKEALLEIKAEAREYSVYPYWETAQEALNEIDRPVGSKFVENK